MKKLFLIALIYFQSFGNAIDKELENIFLNKNDTIIQKGNGGCEFKCRSVDSKYTTQIIGYDFTSGTTYCEIFESNNRDYPLKYNANQQNMNCVTDLESRFKNAETSLVAQKHKTTSIKSRINQNPSDTDITISRFLTGIVTLDPDIINRDTTALTGQLQLQDGITTRTGGVSGLYQFDRVTGVIFEAHRINSSGFLSFLSPLGPLARNTSDMPYQKDLKTFQGTKTSVADGFSQTNLAYFSNLFENMNDIYLHLQNLLFVLVGSFYLMSIGTRKLQTYMENKQVQAGNQPYLHKFYIPLITIAFFFMPIPEGSNSNQQATLIQKMIRYSASKAVDIADIASAKGAETYMNKMYSSVGGGSADTEQFYLSEVLKAQYTKEQATKAYQKCIKRYGEISKYGVPFAQMNEQQIAEYMETINRKDVNQVSQNNDIKFETCIALENTIWEANANEKKYSQNLEGIRNYYSNNDLQQNLTDIDAFFSSREKELGWINAPIMTASSFMVELQDTITKNVVQKIDMESNTKKNHEAILDQQSKGSISVNQAKKREISDSALGYVAGKLSWFTLPGTGTIYQIIKENTKEFISGLTALASTIFGGPIIGLIGSAFGSAIGSLAGTSAGLVFAPIVVEASLEKVPTLVISVAGMIMIASYLVSLCKYFYISPFVVAFGITMKRMEKITEFLVSGIAIFFKPVLIVLFIYLAMFINTLINEFFLFMSVEQFGVLKVSDQDYTTSFYIGAITSMLKIFGLLGTSYITFKLIVSGPEWTLKMVGIDGSQDNVITQSLSNNLEKRSFVA